MAWRLPSRSRASERTPVALRVDSAKALDQRRRTVEERRVTRYQYDTDPLEVMVAPEHPG